MYTLAGSVGITLFMFGASVSEPWIALALCLTGLALLKL